jgi:ribosomal RNA-processing protein 36
MSTYSSDDEVDEISENSTPQRNFNEEEHIQEQLEEIEFGKLINAQKKLEVRNKSTNRSNKKDLEDKFEAINKSKPKSEPKEFSAVWKPKRGIKNIQKQLRRDPRFDELSGGLNMDRYKANYSFVNELANDYLGKVKDVKTKRGKKIEDNDYELIKKQVNFVKGWVKQNQYKDLQNNIKESIRKENKEREDLGKNPIYLKKQQMKTIVATSKMEQRSEGEKGKFLKRKKHRETRKLRHEEHEGHF